MQGGIDMWRIRLQAGSDNPTQFAVRVIAIPEELGMCEQNKIPR